MYIQVSCSCALHVRRNERSSDKVCESGMPDNNPLTSATKLEALTSSKYNYQNNAHTHTHSHHTHTFTPSHSPSHSPSFTLTQSITSLTHILTLTLTLTSTPSHPV